MEIKEGMTVYIYDELADWTICGGLVFTPTMRRGKVTIEKIYDENGFTIEEDLLPFLYSPYMTDWWKTQGFNAEEIKSKSKENNIWSPENNEEYWYIDEAGFIDNDVFDEWSIYQKNGFEIGNCFETRTEAEFMLERLKVIQELKKFARPFKREKSNWTIFFSCENNEIRTSKYIGAVDNNLYFETAEIALKAAKEVGIERVKKYYLQIKEV